jgi:hypothetical protein
MPTHELLLGDCQIRLPALTPFTPASGIGRVGENTSPYLSPLRTGLDSCPIIRLKLLALQNVCLCVRVCDTLYGDKLLRPVEVITSQQKD